MADLLDEQQITEHLSQLPEWKRDGSTIQRHIQKKGFLGALSLATAVGYVANEAQHHPDLKVHDYNQLTITLTSHDAGGLTATDFDVAAAIDKVTNTPSPNTGG